MLQGSTANADAPGSFPHWAGSTAPLPPLVINAPVCYTFLSPFYTHRVLPSQETETGNSEFWFPDHLLEAESSGLEEMSVV